MESVPFDSKSFRCVDFIFVDFIVPIHNRKPLDTSPADAWEHALCEIRRFDFTEAIHTGSVKDRPWTIVLCVGTISGVSFAGFCLKITDYCTTH
jgi:hypothetical protein